MFDYKYAYLLGDLLFGIPIWLAFFLTRSDLRVKMITISMLVGILGPIVEYFYIQDYWNPQTIFNTPIGIEDFLFGFFFGGTTSVLYQIFCKKYYRSKHTNKNSVFLLAIPLYILSLAFLPFINSIYRAMIAFFWIAVAITYRRKDLVIPSLINGFFASFILSIVYLIFLNFYPYLFTKWWQLTNLSGITFLQIPFEEIAWTFLFGIISGTIYECYMGLTFKNKLLK